jgi:hypothetical protein
MYAHMKMEQSLDMAIIMTFCSIMCSIVLTSMHIVSVLILSIFRQRQNGTNCLNGFKIYLSAAELGCLNAMNHYVHLLMKPIRVDLLG